MSLEPWITSLNDPAAPSGAAAVAQHQLSPSRQSVAHRLLEGRPGDRRPSGGGGQFNPFGTESSTLWLDMPASASTGRTGFPASDEVSGEESQGQANFVQLEPWKAVAHIVSLPPLNPAAAGTTLLPGALT